MYPTQWLLDINKQYENQRKKRRQQQRALRNAYVPLAPDERVELEKLAATHDAVVLARKRLRIDDAFHRNEPFQPETEEELIQQIEDHPKYKSKLSTNGQYEFERKIQTSGGQDEVDEHIQEYTNLWKFLYIGTIPEGRFNLTSKGRFHGW